MAKAYLVIRIKGQADVPYWANTTLNLLKLEKKYRAIILPVKENKSNSIVALGPDTLIIVTGAAISVVIGANIVDI